MTFWSWWIHCAQSALKIIRSAWAISVLSGLCHLWFRFFVTVFSVLRSFWSEYAWHGIFYIQISLFPSPWTALLPHDLFWFSAWCYLHILINFKKTLFLFGKKRTSSFLSSFNPQELSSFAEVRYTNNKWREHRYICAHATFKLNSDPCFVLIRSNFCAEFCLWIAYKTKINLTE